jgi:hypothetical protein
VNAWAAESRNYDYPGFLIKLASRTRVVRAIGR